MKKGQSFDPHKLRQQLKQKFSLYEAKKQYSYDEILFILDQECQQHKCDRDVARQLFQQSITPSGKACLDEVIFRYVENLQTSQLCLTRQEKALSTLKQKLGNLKGTTKAYVHLKIIQIVAHARHSSMPALSYKIQPSDIPPVTVVNSLNPILNHEYTLQLESNSFSIIFLESGIKISEWAWPDTPESIYEGQYYRNVMAQNVSFQIKINYKPKNSHPDRRHLEASLAETHEKVYREKQALNRLQQFEPFVKKKPQVKLVKHENALVDKLFMCLPLLKSHVRNLYYALILLIILECLATISWSMQFLDIGVAFGIIGTLYDQSQSDLGMEMLVCILSFGILIVKSIWGFVTHNKDDLNWPGLVILCIVVKFVCIFLAWIVSVCKSEVPYERQCTFYEGVDPNTLAHEIPQQQKNDIFS